MFPPFTGRMPVPLFTVTSAAFHLPVWFDLGATFAFGLTGALAAIKRGYDIVGVFFSRSPRASVAD